MEIMLTLQGCFKVQVRQCKDKDPGAAKIATICEFPTFLWKSHIICTNDAVGASPWLTMSHVKWQCCSYHLLVILTLLSILGISWKPLAIRFLLFCCVALRGYFIYLAPGLLPSSPWGDKERHLIRYMRELALFVEINGCGPPTSNSPHFHWVEWGVGQGTKSVHGGPHPRWHNLWHLIPD